SGLSNGINIFRWNIASSNNFCNSTSTVSINFNKAEAGPNQEICSDFTQLQANQTSVNSGTWTLRFPITGNPLTEPFISDETDEEAYIQFLKPGNNIFRWTTRNISPNSCISFSEVTITSNIVNGANAGIDRVICTDSLILTGNIPLQGVGTWTILTSTSALITNTTIPNTKIKNLSEGYNVLEWKIKKGICESLDTIKIRNDSPTKAQTVKDLEVCNTNTTITAIAPTQGVGNWFNITGTGIINSPNLNNTTISGLSAGIVKVGWKTSFAGCPDRFDTLKITRFVAIQSDAGLDRAICGDSVFLEGNSIPGFGIWKIISGSGIVVQPNLYNSKVRNISVNGITLLEWEFQTPGCSFSKDYVTITRDFVTPASISGGNQALCVDNLGLNANVPTLGIGNWSIVG
ncbi:MAG: hypothetical protein EAZ07_10615, partial [Cytophagales bacterium]